MEIYPIADQTTCSSDVSTFIASMERINPQDIAIEDQSCSICLREFPKTTIWDALIKPNLRAVVWTECGHIFDAGCLLQWVMTKGGEKCPFCRGQLKALLPAREVLRDTLVPQFFNNWESLLSSLHKRPAVHLGDKIVSSIENMQRHIRLQCNFSSVQLMCNLGYLWARMTEVGVEQVDLDACWNRLVYLMCALRGPIPVETILRNLSAQAFSNDPHRDRTQYILGLQNMVRLHEEAKALNAPQHTRYSRQLYERTKSNIGDVTSSLPWIGISNTSRI